MKFNSAFFSTLLIFSVSLSSLNISARAAQQESAERWFEVEVILFQQLGDKNALKEQFPDDVDASILPNDAYSFDLLTPYLQPKLSNIKKFLPLCGEQDEQHLFLESLHKVNIPVTDELHSIASFDHFAMPDFSTSTPEEETQNNDIVGAQTGLTEVTIQKQPQDTTSAVVHNENDKSLSAANSETSSDDSSNDSSDTQSDISSELSSVSQAEPFLNEPWEFEFDLQEEVLAKPIFSTQTICIITANELEALFTDKPLTNKNPDYFGVKALPTKLHASGMHNPTSPYLIADDSLLLKEITQSLRWSREFKPLLHFGWRQVGITQKDAIAVKLFAGEHLAYQYQQALTDYQEKLAPEKALQEKLAQIPSATTILAQQSNEIASEENVQSNNNTLSELEIAQQSALKQRQAALNQVFSAIEQSDIENIDSIINKLGSQGIEDVLSHNILALDSLEHEVDKITPPKAPLQPWYLDGFFKVHLDHYLYINADFNVLSHDSMLDAAVSSKEKVKLINFSQNRRVITGEIHYFDHPYIGMIVQIRRFDPSKPPEEAVTQAIN